MYIGLDVGTSGIKGLLLSEDQVVVGSARSALEVLRPQQGWSEQDPADWVSAAEDVLALLAEKHPKEMATVIGIGLSGQMHGATLLDRNDQVLRPCMLWNDTRSWVEAAEMDANPDFRRITGTIVFPGFTAPKLAWVRNNEPEVFANVAKVLLPKDYLRLWLTGDHVGDMSDSSGTSWFDTKTRAWSPELLGHTGLGIDHMPRLVEGSEASGTLRTSLAEKYGMSLDVVVAGGAGDNAASAVGMGAVRRGSAFVSLGTSGVVFASVNSYQPDAASAVHTFCHALPETWCQMGVILSAADALEWFSNIVNVEARELTAALGDGLKPPSEVTFLPYLSGERTPHNDTKIKGVFAGLTRAVDSEDMTKAVLEGVAFALADNLSALQSTGASIDRLLAVGGGSQSNYWLQLISTVLGVPVDLPVDGDFGAAFGAARLAMLAASEVAVSEVCTAPKILRSIDPEPGLASVYAEAHGRYRDLYPALKVW